MKLQFKVKKETLGTGNILLILLSFLGLFLLLTIYIMSLGTSIQIPMGKTAIIFIFIVICILGMIAAVNPRVCRGLMIFNQDTLQSNRNENVASHDGILRCNKRVKFQGHHPDCGRFEDHTFQIMGRKFCPGCYGLFAGGLVALVGSSLYFFMGLPNDYGSNVFFIGVGMVMVALIFLIFIKMGNKLKFTSNMALVIGSFLILIGILERSNYFQMGLYFIFLVIIWIITRTSVSETYHEDICDKCQDKSVCIYE